MDRARSPHRHPHAAGGACAFAAVDLGASSGRVVLGVLRGDELDVAELHRFPNRPVVADGRLAWDVEDLFDQTLEGLGRAVAAARDRGAELCGIGVDAWGVDTALLDDAGRIDGAVLHHRGAADPGPYLRRRGLGPLAVYERTGVLDQPINTSFRLSELVEAGIARDQRVLFVPDLWVHLLTGVVGTDPTIASTSQLFDPVAGRWVPELLAAGGLTSLAFPEPSAPGSPAGTTTAQVTARIGASAPVVVHRVAGHDTASAFAFAAPGRSTDEALVSSGTWSVVGVCVDRPVRTAAAMAGGFTNERGVEGTLLVRNLNGLWILHECLREWEATDGRPADLTALLAEAAAVPTDERVLDVASGTLLGSGAMTSRVTALALEAGRPSPATRGELVRAVLDSLAVAYARTIAAAQQLTGTRIARVRLVGGGSQNRLLCRLTADATGLPVIAGPAEATSVGNIVVQARSHLGTRDVPPFYDHLSGTGVAVEHYAPASHGRRPLVRLELR